MEPTASSHYRRRRSQPRLPDFSITPLKSQSPLDGNDSCEPQTQRVHASQPTTPKSYLSPHHSPAPTPSILSRSSSRTRSRSQIRRKIKSALALTELEHTNSVRTNPNGTTGLADRLCKLDASAGSTYAKGHTPRAKSIGSSAINRASSTEWLLQTASVIATTSAESKGQSWLATRSASTSLVGTPWPEPAERSDYGFGAAPPSKAPGLEYAADDELSFSPSVGGSPILSRSSTRRNSLAPFASMGQLRSALASRGTSRASSRLGSRAGSRVNLITLQGRRTPGEGELRGNEYFETLGVDFVEGDADGEEGWSDEDDVDEEGLKRLVWGRVGGWVDWAVGWMDFREGLEGVVEVDEEGEEGKSGQGAAKGDGDDGESKENRQPRKRRRDEIKYAHRTALGAKGDVELPPLARDEDAGVFGDTRWLLGVMGKIIA